MSLKTQIVGWGSGLNWYLLLAKAIAVAAALGFAYMQGAHHCELKQANTEAKQAKAQVRTVVKEVQVRVPVIQTIEKKSVEYRNHVRESGDKLDEANRQPNAGGCHLSPEQLRQFQELANATKQ
jgi:hypothetical protein